MGKLLSKPYGQPMRASQPAVQPPQGVQQPPTGQPTSNSMPMLNGVPIGAYGAQWSGSGYTYDPSTNPRAAAWMDWMRQSDPSARWQEQDTGGQHQWVFTQDHPGAEGTYPELAQGLRNMGGGMTLEPVFERGDSVHPDSERYSTPVPLKDPNQTFNGPIGRMTTESNLKHPRDWVGTVAPLAIMAIATMMSGGAASPGLMSMLGGSNGIGSMGINAITQLGRSGGQFNFNPGMLAQLGRYFMGGGGGG